MAKDLKEIFRIQDGSSSFLAIKPKPRKVQIWCRDTGEYYGDPTPDLDIAWVHSNDGSPKGVKMMLSHNSWQTLTTPSCRAPVLFEDKATAIVNNLNKRMPNKRWSFVYIDEELLKFKH